MAVDDVPVLALDDADLVADPADVAVLEQRSVGEHHGIGLIGAQLRHVMLEVVDVAVAARAVQPPLDQRAVAGGQLDQLAGIEDVIGLGIGVAGLVPVPGRQVDAHAHAFALHRLRGHADQVALPVQPRAGLDRVIALLRRPQREAIVVLGHQHQVIGARRLGRAGPLAGIDAVGIEHGGRRLAVAPFAVQEGVGAEVHQHAEAAVLPGHLLRRRGRRRERVGGACGRPGRRHRGHAQRHAKRRQPLDQRSVHLGIHHGHRKGPAGSREPAGPGHVTLRA